MNQILRFENGTQLDMNVVKKDDKYIISLNIGKYEINKRKVLVSENKGMEEFEGKTVSVFLYGNVLKLANGQVLTTFSSVFDTGKVGDLVLDKTSNHVIISAAGKRLAVMESTDFPSNLFAHRISFKIQINSDTDWKVIRYANLHQHTEYSLLDGITRITELAEKAEYACAITDHGNMYGFLQFYNAMKAQGKKPIIGFEAYVETVDGIRKYFKTTGHNEADEIDERMFDNVKISTDSLNGEHLILLAKNETGLKNLYKLCTAAERHFRRKPHVTYDMLEKYHDGIIATSACIAGTLGQAIKTMIQIEDAGKTAEQAEIYKANSDLADHFIQKMISLFGKEDFYIELQNHHFLLESRIMERIKGYAKKYGLKTTIGIDAHYLNKEDAYVHELWLCNQVKKTISDPKHMKFSGDGYWVHSSEEVLNLFPNDLDAIDNTLEIADKCNVEIGNDGYHLPHFPLPNGETDEFSYLVKLSKQGFDKLFYGKPEYNSREYRDRMNFELKTIKDMGWAAYFLIVSDFIAYASDKNVAANLERYFPSQYFDHSKIPAELIQKPEVYVGSGRGSACGSLVCYCIGITKVDPIKYDLLFERFLNPERVSMPDIDTDFEDSGRAIVRDYCMYKYGANKFSKVITFTTSKAKAAVLNIARVLGYPVSFGQKISNAIPKRPNVTIQEALNESDELRALYEDTQTPEYKKVIDYAQRIEGISMNRSIHACATCITDKPIVEYMPEVYIYDNETDRYYWTTALQGPELEGRGLLKMDFLGLRTLGVAHETMKRIKKTKGIDLVYDDIPLNDVRVYQRLKEGKTLSVFQAESDTFTDTLKKVYSDLDERVNKINTIKNPELRDKKMKELGDLCFNRLADINALVRPGPMDYIGTYVSNMKNPSKITYDDPSEKDVLISTNGVMLYQEQMMILTRKMAGFSMGQSDMARKGCAKKKRDLLNMLKEWFIYGSVKNNVKGCANNNIPQNVAVKVWNDIEKFGSYAFNKSHAIAYSMHTIRTAWLSCYYPAEYISSDLNSYMGKADKLETHLLKAKNQGINVLPPDLSTSTEFFEPKGDAIQFGFSALKQVGKNAALIINERDQRGPFTSYKNFLYRMGKHQSIEKGRLVSLIYSGVLDSFNGVKGETRKDMIDNLDNALAFVKEVKKSAKKETFNIFDMMDEINGTDDISEKYTVMKFVRTGQEFDKEYLLNKEYEFSGFYLSGNPLDEYEDVLREYHPNFISSLKDAAENDKLGKTTSVHLAGTVHSFEKKNSKKSGKVYYTFKIEDKTDVASCLWFSPDLSVQIDDGSVMLFEATAKSEEGSLQLFCKSASPLEAYKKVLQSEKLVCYQNNEIDSGELMNFITAKREKGHQNVVVLKNDGTKSYLCRDIKLSVKDVDYLHQIFGPDNVEIKNDTSSLW